MKFISKYSCHFYKKISINKKHNSFYEMFKFFRKSNIPIFINKILTFHVFIILKFYIKFCLIKQVFNVLYILLL